MKLKSFGCSFIFGTDLHDDGSNSDFAKASQFTYPALLAKKIGYDYQCHARAGAGNLQIFQRILDQAIDTSPTLFVINWTWIDRFSYISENTAHRSNPLGWQTIMPVEGNSLNKIYYKNLHSEFRDKLTTLTLVKSTIDLLIHFNHPFIMTYLDNLIFDQRWHITDGMKHIQDYISPYLTDFHNKNFVDYSKDRGHPISPAMHPLESAHQDVAELIYNNLQYYVKGEYNDC